MPTTAEQVTDVGSATSAEQLPITVYWRPGCPFCSILRRGLRHAGLEFSEIDIWEQPEAAAFVRSVANGNETVPTVTVGTTSLVNPKAARVAELALRTA